MGYVYAKAVVGNPKGTPSREVEFLVDTGTFHSAISRGLATDLGLEAAGEISVTLADKRVVKAQISLAYFRVLDRDSILPIVIIDVPQPLLGATTLEGLGLKVNPVSGVLEHSRPFGVGLL